MRLLAYSLVLLTAGCSCSQRSAPSGATDTDKVQSPAAKWQADSNAASLDLRAECPKLHSINELQRAGIEGNKQSGFTFTYVITAAGPEVTSVGIRSEAGCKFTVGVDGKGVTAEPDSCMALCK